jgi:O-methyltransferase
MSMKIALIRKVKSLFIRFRLHRIFGPFEGALLNLAYLSKVSKWVSNNRNLEFNDFYSSRWDYSKRYRLYEYLLTRKGVDQPIVYLEFGVSGGHSFMWWIKHNLQPTSRFAGFDTFEGLPEDWGGFRKGAMSTHSAIPEVGDSRAVFLKGLFQDTLPGFLKTLDPEAKKVIMMDADLYTSTLYTLTTLAPYLRKGDIILFDQYNVPRHEFLAFQNFITSYYLEFRLIGAANNYYFCAFELQ